MEGGVDEDLCFLLYNCSLDSTELREDDWLWRVLLGSWCVTGVPVCALTPPIALAPYSASPSQPYVGNVLVYKMINR